MDRPQQRGPAADRPLRIGHRSAIFVGSEAQAVGVLQGARQLGCRIPEDRLIVGYNDLELAPYLGLTTVRVPLYEMGRRSVAVLRAQLSEPRPLFPDQ